MRGLIEFSNRAEVRGVVNQLTKQTRVQGVVAEYQTTWLMLMHTDPALWDAIWGEWRRFGPFPFPGPFPMTGCQGVGLGPPPDQLRAEWQKWFGDKDPYQLRVCLRPGSSDDSKTPELDTNATFPIVFEERPLARLNALRTSAGSPNAPSGGAITGAAGDWLGITCGHVLARANSISIVDDNERSLFDRIAALFSGAPHIAGECVRKTELVRLDPAAGCNPYGTVDPSNQLDIGVVKASFADTSILKWSAAAARRESARSGQAAKMLSATGERAARIGGLNIYYVLSDGPVSYCFGGLFEVLALPHQDKIVHPSDSGAWIMRYGSDGDEWFGVALGSDDLRGFAMFAEPVHAWLRSERLV